MHRLKVADQQLCAVLFPMTHTIGRVNDHIRTHFFLGKLMFRETIVLIAREPQIMQPAISLIHTVDGAGSLLHYRKGLWHLPSLGKLRFRRSYPRLYMGTMVPSNSELQLEEQDRQVC